ncbi:hypothetical protein TTY48_00190 [Tsukamurella sp. TY48]|nr:hypothetical protein TTY48_00190 [Tsukamurella sp. TY48]
MASDSGCVIALALLLRILVPSVRELVSLLVSTMPTVADGELSAGCGLSGSGVLPDRTLGEHPDGGTVRRQYEGRV